MMNIDLQFEQQKLEVLLQILIGLQVQYSINKEYKCVLSIDKKMFVICFNKDDPI